MNSLYFNSERCVFFYHVKRALYFILFFCLYVQSKLSCRLSALESEEALRGTFIHSSVSVNGENNKVKSKLTSVSFEYVNAGIILCELGKLSSGLEKHINSG